MIKNTEVTAINSDNLLDRIKLCWGHLKNWKRLKIVQQSKEWLERTNTSFSPTTFIAYVNEVPAGMIEFIPQTLMKKAGLCPCRVNPEKKKMESRYDFGKKFENCLFISCFWVTKIIKVKAWGRLFLTTF